MDLISIRSAELDDWVGRTDRCRRASSPWRTRLWTPRSWPSRYWAQAREQGVELVGPGGLLNQLTRSVLETALEVEMTEHLDYEKHDPAGGGTGNSRNGTRGKRC